MLAIIPARGGSKRVPRKNVLPFNGKPMIAWTIEAALASGRFTKIIVSTDDDEIAAVANRYWIGVDKRPAHLATDEARVVDVCVDILHKFSAEWFACLYATAPMRNAQDIQATTALLGDDCAFALAVADFAMSPHQALRMDLIDNNGLAPMWPDLIEKRHDEMPRMVVDNGSTYAANTAAFLAQRTFYGTRMRGYIMPRERSVDIDTPLDLEYAKWLAGR